MKALTLPALLPALVLGGLLAGAVWHDVRARRIPNQLVLWGALAGLALQATLTPGAGLYAEPFGALGLLSAAYGLGLGLLLLLPMYALGAMGAGDVKLMAMVGAFLGPEEIVGAALFSMMAGGVLSIVAALWQGSLRKVLGNTRVLLLNSALRAMGGDGARIEAPAAPSGKLAYAIAIASGTVLYLVLVRTSGWSVLL
ncbi:A24 family peptidase [Pseudoduganella violacea]|uniref:Prepilin peptidase CpaA n=1 Tax=Pseudoduganella violacea TaxID=1715466 RepID=A0A7W5BDW0_9BURK|nr:A24 family peptidase [Pseudoduganella violacea]MBB3121366.1 prepilin peptidase CpaA [Pseudoduganella violacea]